MRVPSWIIGVLALTWMAHGQPPAQVPPLPADGKATISTTAEEVVLDLIVRDKKGRPVRDLKAEEIEIIDGDQPAKIKSLRFTELEQTANAETKKIDPLRQVRLVTLLFDSLKIEAAIQAKADALEATKKWEELADYFESLSPKDRGDIFWERQVC